MPNQQTSTITGGHTFERKQIYPIAKEPYKFKISMSINCSSFNPYARITDIEPEYPYIN